MMLSVKGDYTKTVDVRVDLRDVVKQFQYLINHAYSIPAGAYLSGDSKIVTDDEWRHGSITSSVAIEHPTEEQFAALKFIDDMNVMLNKVLTQK